MLRRLLALVAYGAIVFVVTIAFFALYQRLRPVPHVQFYTVPCENDAKAAWCGSLETIYLAGAILWAAGGAMLLTGVMLGGLMVLHLTPRRWLTFGAVGIASFAGSAALRQSYSTLSDYYYLSLFPNHYPLSFSRSGSSQ